MIKRCFFWLGLMGAPLIAAPHTFQLTSSPESRLWLRGDSTLHPFSSTATVVTVASAWSADTSATPSDDLAAILNHSAKGTFTFSVPVTSLKSGEKGLDKNMYKSLKSDQNPDIVFALKYFTMAGVPVLLKANGTLKIAGVEKPVELTATAVTNGNQLALQGIQELRMTDYGVRPPSLMMGAIKVRDPVKIGYELILRIQEATANASHP